MARPRCQMNFVERRFGHGRGISHSCCQPPTAAAAHMRCPRAERTAATGSWGRGSRVTCRNHSFTAPPRAQRGISEVWPLCTGGERPRRAAEALRRRTAAASAASSAPAREAPWTPHSRRCPQFWRARRRLDQAQAAWSVATGSRLPRRAMACAVWRDTSNELRLWSSCARSPSFQIGQASQLFRSVNTVYNVLPHVRPRTLS